VLAEHLPEADQALVRGGHVVVVVEERDAPVTRLDEVRDGGDRAAHLVRHDRRDDAGAVGGVDEHRRDPLQVRRKGDAAVVHRGVEHRLHLPVDERLHLLAVGGVVRPALRVDDDEREIVLARRVLGPEDDAAGVRRGRDLLAQQPDEPRAVGAQCPRSAVGAVAEGLGGLPHPRARLRRHPHLRGVVQHVRDGGDRDAGELRHIPDADVLHAHRRPPCVGARPFILSPRRA